MSPSIKDSLKTTVVVSAVEESLMGRMLEDCLESEFESFTFARYGPFGNVVPRPTIALYRESVVSMRSE